MDFVRGKFRRLGAPLLFASTAFFAANRIYEGPVDASALFDAWRIYLYPYGVYWFLQAMLIIFLVICLADRPRILGRPELILAIAVAVEFVDVVVKPDIWVFSFGSALYLLPYFLVGLAARRFPEAMFGRGMVQAFALCLVAAMAVHLWNLVTMDPSGPVSRSSFVAFVMGSTASLLLIRLAPESAFLARIGRYSFAIFLYHVFFAIGTRLVLWRAGVTSLPLVIPVSMLAAICGPILVEEMVRRIGPLRPVMLGEWKRRPAPEGA